MKTSTEDKKSRSAIIEKEFLRECIRDKLDEYNASEDVSTKQEILEEIRTLNDLNCEFFTGEKK